MRASALAVSLLVAATFFTALAPAAEARGFCVGAIDPWCPGAACVKHGFQWVCVPHCDPVGCDLLP